MLRAVIYFQANRLSLLRRILNPTSETVRALPFAYLFGPKFPSLLLHQPFASDLRQHFLKGQQQNLIQTLNMLGKLLASVALCYLAWSFFTLQMNYRRASTMGIPLIRLPVDPLNVLFQVFESYLFRLLDVLPIRLPEFLYCLRRGWYFKDKADMHLKYGPVWALVTPRDIHIHIADSEAIHQVFSRRGDFIRPRKMYSKSSAPCCQ
jgi:hypothetical protein